MTASSRTRFGRVRTAIDAASPLATALIVENLNAHTSAIVHQHVAAMSLAGAISSTRKIGLVARRRATTIPVTSRSTWLPSSAAIHTQSPPSSGTT